MEEIKRISVGELVLHKDNQIIVLNKPSGIATISNIKKEKSLLDLAEIYCKHKLLAMHRLDQPTSGVILFAKNKNALTKLNDAQQKGKIKKTYWAWVKGITPEEGELQNYLWRDGKEKRAKVVSKDHKDAKSATLKFKKINATNHYSLLEIELVTGRFHQIRAQMANQGWPIQGDEKYGAKRGNSDRSIALHARSLTFAHPTKGQQMSIQAPAPKGPLWDTL